MAVTQAEYVPLTKAVVEVLSSRRRPLRYQDLVEELLRRYSDGEKRAILRVFRSPEGGVWSPELDEALRVLVLAGLVEIRGEKIYLRGH